MSGLVVIIGQGDLATNVARVLHHAFPAAQFLVPAVPSRKSGFQARLRRHGLFRAVGQVAFRTLFTRIHRRSRPRQQDIWDQSGLTRDIIPPEQVHLISGVNGADIEQNLKDLRPDVIFVFAVGKILPKTLEAVPAPFVNFHPGTTPKYRGVHTGYWALRAKEPSQFGGTIHLIDAGLDTGPVIKHVTCAVSSRDNISTYATSITVSALPEIIASLQGYCNGSAPASFPAGEPAPIFHDPTLWQYLTGGLLQRIW